jgi:hypothetical protein
MADRQTPTVSLFSPGVRTAGPVRYRGSEFEHLDNTAGEVADRARALMEHWFLRVPASAQPQIRERFRSAAARTHRGAFFELYVHELATRLGYDVTVDIGNDATSERRPDFRLRRDITDFQIEATTITGDDIVGPGNRARVQQLYDAIDSLENREFLVGVALREVGPRTPGRKLVAKIDRWLAELDPDDPPAVADDRAARESRIEHDGWIVDVEAIAIRADLRGRDDFGGIGARTEGFESGERGHIEMRKLEDAEPIAKALRSKAGHGYELDNKPFVIAALCAGTFAVEEDVAEALLGPVVHRIPFDGGPSRGEYQGGGLWLDDRCEPRNTRVSAVLTVFDLRPTGCAVVKPILWTNPWARHPLPDDALPWSRYEIQRDGRIVTHDATATPAAVLGLHPRWPAAS